MAATNDKPLTPAQASKLLGSQVVAALAERTARREARHAESRYGPNVLAISVARRVAEGKTLHGANAIAILFVVEKKLSPAALRTKRGEVAIPDFLLARTRHRNRLIRVAFRTDVVEQPRATLHAPAGTHVRVYNPPMSPERGAVCCLVREATGTALYMLSCNHVFGRMRDTPNWSGKTGARIDLQKSSVPHVARVARRADIAKIHRFNSPGAVDRDKPSLDAALALVPTDKRDKVSSGINGYRSRDVFRALTQLQPSTVLKLISPYTSTVSGPKRARVIAVYRDGHKLRLNDGGRDVFLYFKRLIEYVVLDGETPRGGDSGSAVLNSSGKLVGMHFAGDSTSGHGFAMPAADIFTKSTFGRPIRLEPSHR